MNKPIEQGYYWYMDDKGNTEMTYVFKNVRLAGILCIVKYDDQGTPTYPVPIDEFPDGEWHKVY